MSVITSWKAAISSACRWICSAIFSLNLRGLELKDAAPEPVHCPRPAAPTAAPVKFIITLCCVEKLLSRYPTWTLDPREKHCRDYREMHCGKRSSEQQTILQKLQVARQGCQV